MKTFYKLKEMTSANYPNLGVVKNILIQGPKAVYAFLYYEKDRQIHQIKSCGFATHENKQALETAKKVLTQ